MNVYTQNMYNFLSTSAAVTSKGWKLYATHITIMAIQWYTVCYLLLLLMLLLVKYMYNNLVKELLMFEIFIFKMHRGVSEIFLETLA